MSSHESLSARKPFSRTELIWLAAAVGFGSIIRLAFLGRIAVEHFDEGVYASNFWFGPSQGYTYPAQHLYAPPLLPTAIEWTMIVANLLGIKPTGFIPMIPSLLAGIAMIPSIWWVGRRWSSPTAGLVSAWIVATSDLHACYSRAALTDVPVCLFMLWAVYFTWKALVKATETRPAAIPGKKSKVQPTAPLPRPDIALAAGFTALSWWTKYNGWLPLAIGIAGSMLWLLITPKESRRFGSTVKCLAAIATIAFLAWSPVLWGLQSTGGYAAVAANHKQYIVGFKGWIDSARAQLRHVGMYDDWIGLFFEPAIVRRHSRINSPTDGLADSQQLQQTESSDGDSPSEPNQAGDIWYHLNGYLLYLFPISLLAASLVGTAHAIRTSTQPNMRIAACLLLAWILGMTVSTPFYHPYPRLVFPWLVSIWLGIGLAFDCWRNRNTTKPVQPTPTYSWSPSILETAFICWLAFNCFGRLNFGAAHAWADRTGTAQAGQTLAAEIAAHIAPKHQLDDGAIAYIWGEPATLFALKAAGMNYLAPVQNLASADQRPQLPTFLVYGNQSNRGPEFNEEKKRLSRCEFIKLVRFHQSHLVELDSKNTTDFYLSDKSREALVSNIPTKGKEVPNLWLYRVKEN